MAEIGEYKPDNLIAGDFPRVTEKLEVASTFKRGTVMNAEGTPCTESSVPYGIIAEDAADAPLIPGTTKRLATVYLTGEFAKSQLTGGWNSTAGIPPVLVTRLRQNSIFVKDTVPAV